MALLMAGALLAPSASGVTLARTATVPQGFNNYYQIPTGDLDHDGRQELAFEQARPPFSGNIWASWGSSSYQPVAIREGCIPIAGGDPDGDGLSDLLCQWGPKAFLLESATPGSFPSREVWSEPLGGFPGIR